MATKQSAPILSNPLLLLSSFVRALSHSVRTPLSVLSNDLYYFQSHLPKGECTKSSAKIDEITHLLTELSSLVGGELVLAPHRIGPLIKEVYPQIDTVGAGHYLCIVDEGKLRGALTQLNKLLEVTTPPEDLTGTLQCTKSSVVLTLQLPTTAKRSAVHSQTFSSFSECFSSILDLDSPFPPVIDSIIWAQGGSIEVTGSNPLVLIIELPISDG